ncbi:sigma-54 dependent transcriptional regulator [Salinarimonas sp.]|uniref:sigma-54-dependent transcriptional regulator n=1 Tax=Salinarimonas sp. TaxID=2766526 RepID=UPI0032D8EA7E
MSLEHRTVALVEDDAIMGESLVERLVLEGARVVWMRSVAEAFARLPGCGADVVLCDIRLPDGLGEDVFETVAETGAAPPFLFITAHADIDQAVRLMRRGALDYVTKPFALPDLLARLGQALPPLLEPGEATLGVSPEMRRLETLLRRVAGLPMPALLVGETGVGKEVCARTLHERGRAAKRPFMAVNCAAIPADLMESELFGHEKGAFTGAAARHHGYAERAKDGVLFLDEIGDLDLRLQAKLLRLVEEKTFQRVGGEATLPFAARLVCATNVDLGARVRDGRFREDLYYRINVVTLEIPPLRRRREDVPWLARAFFDRFVADSATHDDARATRLEGLHPLALEALAAHDWPGNVRELRNRVERAVALASGPWITPGDLFPERKWARGETGEALIAPLDIVREDAERRQIIRALEVAGGVGPAASALGISRTTMWEKMRRLQIAAPGAS